MATIKSFTDVSQSKKLAEILPVESADMCWTPFDEEWDAYLGAPNPDAIKKEIPCWSLAALLSVLPYPETWQDHSTNRWACSSLIKDTEYLWESENLVDSCVEVIIKLHKEGLL